MLRYYLVSFMDNIENLINDDDIFFDGEDLNEDVDVVFEVFAEDENDAKEKYLRMSAQNSFDKKNRLELIRRECAARVIRRIVAGELLLLPRDVLACENIGQMIIMVYDVMARYAELDKRKFSTDLFAKIAADIDLNEFASLLDKESVIALYMELYAKDVFVQELKIF